MTRVCLFILALAAAHFTAAAEIQNVEFRADYYERNMATNTIKGRGNAWLKKDAREIWANERIEFNFNTNHAFANGNVHIREKAVDAWCRHAEYDMKGDDVLLSDYDPGD